MTSLPPSQAFFASPRLCVKQTDEIQIFEATMRAFFIFDSMIQPVELKLPVRVGLSNGAFATTAQVWDVLVASRQGNMEEVKKLADECPELLYAQYNYTPPIHFAVREGHVGLVKYLLEHGAHDPDYKTYPFLDSLLTIAHDRGYQEIEILLEQYQNSPPAVRFKGDNGEIHYKKTTLEQEFQEAVGKGEIERTEAILKDHPEFVRDQTFFWSEGIMMMPAKDRNRKLLEILLHYDATVPDILKWAQAYYFKHYEIAAFLMENDMNPNVMSWHHVSLLHDMAQKGNIPKAELLIKHGAAIDPVEEEYQSTPLGMAARWGHTEMVQYLLAQDADPNKSGAAWSTPLAWAKKKEHRDIENILLKAGAR